MSVSYSYPLDEKEINTTVHAAQEITARVLALTSFKNATSVSCYLSMPSGEVRTPAIVDAVLTSGMSTHPLRGASINFEYWYRQNSFRTQDTNSGGYNGFFPYPLRR